MSWGRTAMLGWHSESGLIDWGTSSSISVPGPESLIEFTNWRGEEKPIIKFIRWSRWELLFERWLKNKLAWLSFKWQESFLLRQIEVRSSSGWSRLIRRFFLASGLTCRASSFWSWCLFLHFAWSNIDKTCTSTRTGASQKTTRTCTWWPRTKNLRQARVRLAAL